MEDTPTPSEPAYETALDRSSLPDPGATRAPTSTSTAPSMTLKQWAASQPYRPLPRVPRMVLAHIYKGDLKGPPSKIIEPPRKSARINWVRAFQEAKAALDAAGNGDQAEGS